MTTPATFLLLTFKHERFVRAAVRGALAQDYRPLDILISDDASPDGTFSIISDEVRAYRGPHRVRLNCNERRLGSVEHLMKVMGMVETEFVVMAHGDDISLPHRTGALVAAWKDRNVSMLSSNARFIDARGNEYKLTAESAASRMVPFEEMVAKGWIPEMLGATLAFEPAVLRKFDPLTRHTLAAGLDHVLPLRAAAMKGLYHLAEPLLLYRRHDDNMTNVIADRTTSRLVQDNTYLAFEMAARIRTLDDLRMLEAATPDDGALARLRARLEARLLDDLRSWSRMGAELHAADLRPTWLSAQEMAARRIRPELSLRLDEPFPDKVRRWLRPPLLERIRNRLRGMFGVGPDVEAG